MPSEQFASTVQTVTAAQQQYVYETCTCQQATLGTITAYAATGMTNRPAADIRTNFPRSACDCPAATLHCCGTVVATGTTVSLRQASSCILPYAANLCDDPRTS